MAAPVSYTHLDVYKRQATGYERSDDGMTWTFTLRDDVYFHSGKHCTAYDFEWTYARLLDEENPTRYLTCLLYTSRCV